MDWKGVIGSELTKTAYNDKILVYVKEAYMKKRILALVLLFLVIQLFPGEKDFLKKAKRFNKEKEYSKALEAVGMGLAEHGESIKLLALKCEILVNLNKLDDALNTAIKRADVSKRKSPWHCLDIVSICLKMKNLDKAFEWLNKAVSRGLLSYTELYEDERFSLLIKDKRFDTIVETIKSNIGIGKPAKDFTVDLLSGETFTLSKQKGKVVLIDFWATWCPPCVKGIPHLKEFYEEYKSKGFEVLGISLDSDGKAVDDYVKKEALTWGIVFSGNGWLDETAKYYKVNLIPSYWLIDRKGILRNFGVPLRDKEKMKKAIEELVLEKK